MIPQLQQPSRELRFISSRLEALERQRVDLERELQQISQLQKSISAEKTVLEARQRELEAQQIPINWLPNELLIAIFLEATRADLTSADLALIDDPPGIHDAVWFHRPPVVLSHVCRRWRELAISTSTLWSRIVYSAPLWHKDPVVTFLERAGAGPLAIFYHHYDHFTSPTVARDFLAEICKGERTQQSRDLTLRFYDDDTLLWAYDHLANVDLLRCGYPQLRSLDVSILGQQSHPGSFSDWDPLVFAHQSCQLQHLRLRQVPLRASPPLVFCHLQTLELDYPQLFANSLQHQLRMAHVCNFLACFPRLEELVLTSFTPSFDALVSAAADPEHNTYFKTTLGIPLKSLKVLVWKNACHTHVHRFLSFLNMPNLRVLDLSLSKPHPRRLELLSSRLLDEVLCDHTWEESEEYHAVLTFSELSELRVESPREGGESEMGYALRRLTFPALDKLEIAEGRQSTLPSCLPRLESIMRDPRLPTLTQVTLCRWEIDGAHGTTMLAYMPALVSLELNECFGVDFLLDGLAECVGIAGATGGRKAVKLCPKLTTLTFRKCDDLDYGQLLGLLKIRNASDWEEGGDVTLPAARTLKPLRRRSAYAPAFTASVLVPAKPVMVTYVRVVRFEYERGSELPDGWVSDLRALSVREIYVD
jgi:hypothetical protein